MQVKMTMVIFLMFCFKICSIQTNLEVVYVDEEIDPAFYTPNPKREYVELQPKNSGPSLLLSDPIFKNIQPEIKDSIILHQNWHFEEYRLKTIDLLFNRFTTAHEKDYISKNELTYRKQIFTKTLKEIGSHNESYAKGYRKFYKKIGKFADITNEEFMKTFTHPLPPKKMKSNNLLSNNELKVKEELKKSFNDNSDDLILKDDPAPYNKEIDWKAKRVVGPVEDQGRCGACYSFATVGSTESAYAIKNGGPSAWKKLSKQELVDCGAATGLYLKGCQGGVLQSAYTYMKDYGISQAKNYPFIAEKATCKRDKVPRFIKIQGYNIFNDPTKNKLLKLIEKGPASLAIEVLPSYKDFGGGIVDVKGPCGFFYNHGIMTTGYSITGPDEYLVLKNTYGKNWGIEGYMNYNLGVGANGMCGVINTSNSAPIV